MTNEISWQVELMIKPGKLENFRALTLGMVESTKDEHGVLLYVRSVSDDGGVVYVYERYTDPSYAVSELLAFGIELQRANYGYGSTQTIHGFRCSK